MSDKTILEAARELGYTKNAVKYQVNKLPPDQFRKNEKGTVYITDAGIETLSERMGNKQPVNNRQTTTQQPENNREENTLYRALLQTIETLQDQLAAKDNQLKAAAEAQAALLDALKIAQQTAAAAQALHAGTMQQGLKGSQIDENDERSEGREKKSRDNRCWFSRIFKQKEQGR